MKNRSKRETERAKVVGAEELRREIEMNEINKEGRKKSADNKGEGEGEREWRLGELRS